MFKSEYGSALKEWVAAQKRIEASEERIRQTFLDWYFGRDAKAESKSSRPCVNVTPPKQPPKK
jgi:hypothetical protein